MRIRLALLAVLLIAVQAAAGAQTISIAQARTEPLGTVVTVQGAVTVPSAAFTSSTFDRGFAIQDATGGIYVSTGFDPGLNLLRRVRVTGTLDDDGFGLLVLRPASETDVVRLFGAVVVAATPADTGDVSEGTEGLLLVVEGTARRGQFSYCAPGSVLVRAGVSRAGVSRAGVSSHIIAPGSVSRRGQFSYYYIPQYDLDAAFADLTVKDTPKLGSRPVAVAAGSLGDKK